MAEILTKGINKRGNWRGVLTANGASVVTVADSTVSPFSLIHITLKTPGGTPAPIVIQSVTPNVGFTFTSSAGNTSLYNYAMMG